MEVESRAKAFARYEVSAGGNLLMDAVEYGVLRRALDSGERSKAAGSEANCSLFIGAELLEVGLGRVGAVRSSALFL